ncbi:3-deoxy-D-manno-octulosonic acid kinase [Alcaligenaceae bacterium SJ-26]|nr:3-deoxy-D-manno-octulosonic acid kinase [Alcaligenaceae bacterium SJ-26]
MTQPVSVTDPASAIALHRSLGKGAAMLYAAQVPGLDASVWQPGSYASAHIHAVSSGGRQAAWFVEGPWGQAVLRQYRRGGLVARISRDLYVWQGESKTRSFAEFRIMEMLWHAGLRVPRPLAAAYWRSAGVLYRAALLTQRVENAVPLADCMAQADPARVAQSIADMHAAGVWHADLNAHNILLDPAGEAWLIDFDRARAGGCSAQDRQNNLMRLKRSMLKLAGTAAEAYWQAIFVHYQQIARQGA